MSGVIGMPKGIASINKLKAAIRELPLRMRTAVAKDAQGILDREMTDAFASGQTVYGTPRPLGVNGTALSLVKSGRTKAALHFVVIGTIIRAQLGSAYAKYLVGKYKIMPQSLPAAWRVHLERLVGEYVEIFQQEALR